MHLNGFLILQLKWLLFIYWVAVDSYRSEPACAAIFWLMSSRHNSSGGDRLRQLHAEGKGSFFSPPSVTGF